jgi:hypothetical protein
MGLFRDWHFIWLFVASFLAGTLNAMAGGGSFLSFPALLSVGVLPIQANATNTVALWPGQLTSIAAYWEDLKHNFNLAIPMGLASLTGGLLGAIVLLRTGQATFMHLIPWLLLLAALLFWVSEPISNWLQRRSLLRSPSSRKPSLAPLVLSTAVVAFYIGYFGAGAGFLIMAALGIFGLEDINQINALKVVCAACANGIAVATFIVRGQVLWRYCLLMMVTAAIGGYLGGSYSRKVNPRLMRLLIVSIGITMAGYFFWKQAR